MNWTMKLLLSIAALCVLLVVAAGLLLSQGKSLGPQHAPFAPPPFDFAGGNYADYIAHTRNLLATGRVDAASAAVIDNLLPFELEAPATCARDAEGKVAKGIVLIHGLYDGPWSMRHFGEDLQNRCLHVLGLLLPDHGTRPGDFLDADWENWAAAVRFAAAQLSERANTVILAGHSAGGTLALLDALRYPQADALILFAPALAITPSAKYARFVAPLGLLFPKAAWFGVESDTAVYRYESITFTSAAQMHELISVTQQAWNAQQRQLPVFTVASAEDSTVGTGAILEFMAMNSHPLTRTLLYSQHPQTGSDRVEVIGSNALEQGVLSVSHLGLMTPPGHPHYGRDGSYRNCGHYGADEAGQLARCKAGERDWYGETTRENLAMGVVERIAFNPWYPQLLERVSVFLDSL